MAFQVTPLESDSCETELRPSCAKEVEHLIKKTDRISIFCDQEPSNKVGGVYNTDACDMCGQKDRTDLANGCEKLITLKHYKISFSYFAGGHLIESYKLWICCSEKCKRKLQNFSDYYNLKYGLPYYIEHNSKVYSKCFPVTEKKRTKRTLLSPVWSFRFASLQPL